jgi:hypothetical protein
MFPKEQGLKFFLKTITSRGENGLKLFRGATMFSREKMSLSYSPKQFKI